MSVGSLAQMYKSSICSFVYTEVKLQMIKLKSTWFMDSSRGRVGSHEKRYTTSIIKSVRRKATICNPKLILVSEYRFLRNSRRLIAQNLDLKQPDKLERMVELLSIGLKASRL